MNDLWPDFDMTEQSEANNALVNANIYLSHFPAK